MNFQQAVYEILVRELAVMLEALKRDTPSNVQRKANNFLLSRFDPEVIFYTVFTSSFESKSGNAMENCAKAIARLRYGPESVPNVILGLGTTSEDLAHVAPDPYKQVILTRRQIKKVEERSRTILTAHRVTGRGRTRSATAGVSQEILRSDLLLHDYSESNVLEQKPVDLFIQPPDGPALVMEIKLGGDLDSSNAPAQLAKFLTTCVLVARPEIQGYFATIYNKDGEGRRFTGTVRSYLADDMILAGSAFWELLLPSDMSFSDFVALYHQALDKIGINQAIREMVKASSLPSGEAQQVIRELTD